MAHTEISVGYLSTKCWWILRHMSQRLETRCTIIQRHEPENKRWIYLSSFRQLEKAPSDDNREL
jgi:hypothetical protein